MNAVMLFRRLPVRTVIALSLVAQLTFPASLLAQQAGAAVEQSAAATRASQPTVPPAGTEAAPLRGDSILLQVLNRFTYGPRPGDLEHLRTIGLSAWFQAQLNPESIDDSALDKRLADYPAMNMPLYKLMELYPSNGTIRASLAGRASSPGGDAAKAIYADQSERYKDKKKGKTDAAAVEEDATLPQDAATIAALPPAQRFKALCHLNLAQLKQLRRSLSAEERDHLTDGMTPAQTEALAAFNGPRGVVEAEDIQVKLLRDVYSERQLKELMVDFWLNHFNVYMKKSQQAPYYIAAYERDAIRPYALGHFEHLLVATATSPAMLNYLDNASSIGPRSDYALGRNSDGSLRRSAPKSKDVGLNENYGRELMELHTLGVGGGYTQHDVTEVAKVFTGWTVGKQRGQDVTAQAEFDADKHEPGDKTVLGQKIKYGGQSEGQQVLHLLANNPATARFISTKLALYFVSDTPPSAMVDRMAAKFLESRGDIRQVLLTMIHSPEFFTESTYRSKVKTPQQYVVSAVRAAGSDVKNTGGMAEAVAALGMPLYGMQTPNGYSMKSDAWNNTAALVSRMNFALALATNKVSGVSTDFDRLLGGDGAPLSAADKDAKLEQAILHVPVSDRTRTLILQQTAQDPRQQASDLRQVAAVKGKRDPLSVRSAQDRPADPATLDTQAALASGLVFGSPEFQRR